MIGLVKQLVLAAWLLLGPAAWAAGAVPEPASAATPALPASQPAMTDEQLRSLVGQLDDPSYRLRELAGKKLAQLDAGQIRRLVPFYKAASQPEARLRLREAAKAIFIAGKRSGLAPEGFLGVQLRQSIMTAGNGEKIVVAEIISVVPDSPADKSGLRAGDQIVTLFGQPIRNDDGERLRDKVRRMAPGDLVKLRVWRGQDRLDLAVTLGDRARLVLAEDIPAEWGNQFRQFWRETFDPNEPPDDPASP